MKKIAKIYATLVALVMVATVLPSVSAAPTAMSSVDDESTYLFAAMNYTADDVKELFGLSLDEDESLWLWYYNEGMVLTEIEIEAYEDGDEIVWFDVSEIADKNITYCQAFFSDEDEDDPAEDATEALFVNEVPTDEKFIYIITIPDGVKYEYDDYTYFYDDENISVEDDDGDEYANISSFVFNADLDVYAMNVSDDDTSHQIVIITDDSIHGSGAAAVSGKYIDEEDLKPWYLGGKWLSPKTTYSMKQEQKGGYTLLTGDKVAANVYKDTGMLSQYIGGKTNLRMNEDSFQYNDKKWYEVWKSAEWKDVGAHEISIDSINIGLIEYIYLSEETGAEDNDEVIRGNFGLLCSRGTASDAGITEMFTKGLSKTPDIMATGDTTIF